MFNLDLAIHQWCARVLHNHSITSNKIDELKDHLYCAIEAGQTNGLSEEQAFDQAIEQIGRDETLKESFDMNLSITEKMCAFEYGKISDFSTPLEGEKLMKIYQRLILSNSILWAAAILVTALMTRGMEDKPDSLIMLLVILATMSVFSIKQLFKGK